MKSYIQENVTLISEDNDELFLVIKDELSGVVQTYALLPDELSRIVDVIQQYKKSTGQHQKVL